MSHWRVAHNSLRSESPRFQRPIDDGASDDDDLDTRAPGILTSGPQTPPDDQAAPLHLPAEMYCPTGIKRLPLWHERWPAAELAKARDRNLRSFQRAYGQRPIADHEFVFSAATVDASIDRSLVLGTLPQDPKARWRIVAGIDPAGGGVSAASAFWALAVVAVHEGTGHRYLLQLVRHRGLEIDDHRKVISDVYRQHRWTMCNLEKNNVQRLLLAEYQKTGAPMQTVQTTQSKHVELEMMGAEFAKGIWYLPMADQFSRARVQPLVEELKAYPTGRF